MGGLNMRNSWIVVSAFFMATTMGCGGKSAGEQLAEMQLNEKLEAEKVRKAKIVIMENMAKAEAAAADKASADAIADLAKADLERTKAEARKRELDAQMEKDRPMREAAAAAEKLRLEKVAAAEKMRQMKLREQQERIRELQSERSAFAGKFPVFTNGLIKSPASSTNSQNNPRGRAFTETEKKEVGLIQAKNSLAELEAISVEAGRATLNPTLRNGPGNNGRLNFQSANLRETFKGNLNKDLSAVKRFIAGLEAFDKDIEEASK